MPDTPFDILPKRPEAPEPPAAPAADEHSREGLLVPPVWLDQLQAEIERYRELRRQPGPAEPTIQVTIGRVEVRCQGPPAPIAPKRKAKAPAVMSLDDYLKQRKGRGSL